MATYKLSSQRKNIGTRRLRSYQEATKSTSGRDVSKADVSPTQYAAKVAAQPTPTTVSKAPATTYSFGGVLEKAMQPSQIQQLQKRYAPNGILENVISQQQAKKQALIIGSGVGANPTTRDKENIRAIIGTGYTKPDVIFGATTQAGKIQAMVRALNQDITIRGQRINTRENKISQLEGNLIKTQTRVNYYNSFIKNGKFTGTPSQYNAYKKAYADYEKNYNQYSRAVKLQNTDISTYNKNVSSIKAKKGFKKTIVLKNKIGAAYTRAEKRISKEIPTVKQAEPYIRQFVKTSAPAGIVASTTDKILKRKDTEKIIQFYLGGYESVQQRPLKAAATFATFFVGGIALKGLGSAAKVLGAGARTAKAAHMIETGLLQVYITASGVRLVESKDARELGYNTGDIIFNELLPAGMGLKYGVRVVSKIPRGARQLKATGRRVISKTARETSRLARSTKAEVEITRIGQRIKETSPQKTVNRTISEIQAEIRLQKQKAKLLEELSKNKITGGMYKEKLKIAESRIRQLENLKMAKEQARTTARREKARTTRQRAKIKTSKKTIQKQKVGEIGAILSIEKSLGLTIQKQKQKQKERGVVSERLKSRERIKTTETQLQRTTERQRQKQREIEKQRQIERQAEKQRQKERQKTKVEEKPPETILPKLKSITSKKKAKKTTKTSKAISKQRNVNAVATFKDLLK